MAPPHSKSFSWGNEDFSPFTEHYFAQCRRVYHTGQSVIQADSDASSDPPAPCEHRSRLVRGRQGRVCPCAVQGLRSGAGAPQLKPSSPCPGWGNTAGWRAAVLSWPQCANYNWGYSAGANYLASVLTNWPTVTEAIISLVSHSPNWPQAEGVICSVHCTVNTIHCTVYFVHCTVYMVQCTLYTVHFTLYTLHCTL